ncbi:MAG: HTH-type transcriptional regulator McbR [Syntrophaceae bacterium PtaU1.Bin231]|nr:MAG: HTH-type transcriptional regulator McbR [Syntrophaceae bacterium PtaU1.Bin231]HOG18604.1 GntR family transcriptional regulator [Syntrophales bacterium]
MMKEATENLIQKAYLQLKNMIFYQRISPGQKLIYRELAVVLGMSSTPVQLALCKLEQEGFVERIPNIGYYVRRIDIREIEDLFDLRQILEVYAIEQAIQNQTPEDLEILHQMMLSHKNHDIQIYDRKKLLLDAEFHWQIAAMSKNQAILRQLRSIFEHSYLRSRVELLPPDRLLVTAAQHAAIYEMIREHKTARAKKAIATHIREAKEAKLMMLSRERSDQ